MAFCAMFTVRFEGRVRTERIAPWRRLMQAGGRKEMSSINQNRDVDPTRWLSGDWSTESADDALQRAPGFARDFFERLYGEFPGFQHDLVFLRCSGQPNDIYAVLDRSPGGLLVQIDPDLEYIVVRNEAGQGEYGDWGNGFDRIEEALKQIRACEMSRNDYAC